MNKAIPFTEADALALLDHALELRAGMVAKLAKMNFSTAFVERIANADPMDWLDRKEREMINDHAAGKVVLYGELPPEEPGAQAASDATYRQYLAKSFSPLEEQSASFRRSRGL